jgi:hypothetical protein
MVKIWFKALLHGASSILPLKHKWQRNKVSFDNQFETREAPLPLSGQQMKQDYESF